MRSVVALWVLASCANDGIAIEDYADAARAWKCRYYVQCGLVRDLETCERTNIGWYFTDPELLAAVDEGRVRWDAAAAERCLAQQVSCDITSSEHWLRCDPLTHGTRHKGEACEIGAECISHECAIESCDGSCCTGSCIGDAEPVAGGYGDDCRFRDCREGYCDSRGVCARLLPAGSPCDSLDACAERLACRTYPDDSRRCTALAGHGKVCDGACAEAGDVCGPRGVCESAHLLGAPCELRGDCSDLYICGPDYTCLDPGAKLGESCANTSRCVDLDAFCNPNTLECERRYMHEPPACPGDS